MINSLQLELLRNFENKSYVKNSIPNGCDQSSKYCFESKELVMENRSQSGIFLEDLLEGKVFSGAAPSFDEQSLIFKNNTNGIRGMHAVRPYKANELIISLDNSSSISHIRAFDETQDMLSKLGNEKYSLPKKTLLALAVYKRHKQNSQTDALFTSIDLEKAYKNTPMATLQKEFAEFVFYNSKKLRWKADLHERLIRTIGLDFDLFSFCYAFVTSRCWSEPGILPVLDLFNASHGGHASAYFKEFENKYAFFADRDIQAGEEITWNYNNASAFHTFYSYGYLDPKRIYESVVEFRMEDNEIQKLIDTWGKHCDLSSNKMRNSKLDCFDVNQYQNTLYCPGKKSEGSNKKKQIASSIASYKSVLTTTRMRLISKKSLNFLSYSPIDSKFKYFCVYGLEFDLECIHLILNELRCSKEQSSQRTKKFMESPVGPQCDVTPITDIYNHTYSVWEKCLGLMEKLIFVENAAQATHVITNYLGLEFNAEDLKSFLARSTVESPELELELASQILSEKGII
jgi:hypothetical protein